MSDKKKPFQRMQDEMMLQIDFKEKQRRENYRRAEAFLLWKFGPMYDEARRFLRGSGMDWPSLFVEFVEKVEEDLLARMRDYDKTFWENNQAKAQFGPFVPQTIQLTDAETEALSKDWPGIRIEAGKYEWTPGKPLKDCKKEEK